MRFTALCMAFALLLPMGTSAGQQPSTGEPNDINKIMAELKENTATEQEAVNTARVDLKKVAELDALIKPIDDEIKTNNATIEANRMKCQGTYSEPQYSYWKEFCGNLNKKGEWLVQERVPLLEGRLIRLADAKLAEERYKESYSRIRILLVAIRNHNLLACDCSGAKTQETEAACYQKFWDNSHNSGYAVPGHPSQ